MKLQPLIAILIPSIVPRAPMLRELLNEFNSQLTLLEKEYYGMDNLGGGIFRYNYKQVEILTYIDRPAQNSIGSKRNSLKKLVRAKYMQYFDDDDQPAEYFFKEYFDALKIHKDVDCCSLRGLITTNGNSPELFEHSIKYNAYRTVRDGHIKYERYPNHLNLIKTEIAQKFTFPDINRGEDTNFAEQVFRSKLIKTEAYINKTMYFYRYKTKK